jgi:hypothetical protein
VSAGTANTALVISSRTIMQSSPGGG